ncbi:MAG: SusD/RagB family nutrient-binding outer membrane lipoprotein [Flavobacteriaceae bacterium]
MKKIYKFLLLTMIATSGIFYSCETTDLNLKVSPNALSPTLSDADLLLNSIQLDYVNSITTFNNLSGQLSRIDYLFGRNYFSAFGPGTLNGPWNRLYSGMIPDIANLEAINSPDLDLSFHLGVSKIMEAHLMMQMVDFLGDVVWTERNNPIEFPNPTVDSGQDVYTAAIALLDEAKGLLNGASVQSATDLFYQGDTDKWIKLANTLKMRADLTVGNWQAVLDASNVISSTADDFEYRYGTNVLQPDTRHPDYAQDYTSSGANIYQSNWLMQLMSGSTADWRATDFAWSHGDPYPQSDPRRRFYFYRQSWNVPGAISLMEHSGVGAAVIYPDDFGADNSDGETLQCSLQSVPTHLEFTPDEEIWCSVKLGYWGRFHGNDEGTPPDNFTRTASGVYPAGGSFDNQDDIPNYVSGSGLSNIPHGAVGLGNGAGGGGIEPIMLASYSHFMKAEAALHLGDAPTAATHFQMGITASIDKVTAFGGNDPDADSNYFPTSLEKATFIADMLAKFNAADMTTGVDGFGFPTAKDKMDILGEQYFVAMFGGAGDAYNFIRRTGYPRTLSREIEAGSGLFPRTLLYPGSEIASNPSIHQRTDNSTKTFWDTGVLNPAN